MTVDVEHNNAYENPEVGTLWTDGEDVGILAVVDSKGDIINGKTLATKNKPLYAVIIFDEGMATRWKDPTTNKQKAVEGLDPFYGTVTLTQE